MVRYKDFLKVGQHCLNFKNEVACSVKDIGITSSTGKKKNVFIIVDSFFFLKTSVINGNNANSPSLFIKHHPFVNRVN